jgi:hypothetical protein
LIEREHYKAINIYFDAAIVGFKFVFLCFHILKHSM